MTEPRDKLAMHVAGAHLSRRGSGYHLSWDVPSAEATWYAAGFREIGCAGFRESQDPTMAVADSRLDDTLFLEAIRN